MATENNSARSLRMGIGKRWSRRRDRREWGSANDGCDGKIVANGDRQTIVATVRSSRMGSLQRRDRYEWQRINNRRDRCLDAANVIWFGVGIVWMLGCCKWAMRERVREKEKWKKKIKKGWRSFSISALVRNSNSSLLITSSNEIIFVTNSVLINTFISSQKT